jgi:hypothetical protein
MGNRIHVSLPIVLAASALLWAAGCATPAPAPVPDQAQQDACLGNCGVVLPTPLPLATSN